MQSIIRYLPKTIGIGLFILIVINLDTDLIFQNLARVSLWTYLAALPLSWIAILIKGERWRCILVDLSILISRWNAFLMYLAGIFWGSLTPGRIGELARIGYLIRDNQNTAAPATFSVVLDRLFDVLAMGLLSTIAFLKLWESFKISPPRLIFLTITLSGVFVCICTAIIFCIPKIRQSVLIARFWSFLKTMSENSINIRIRSWLYLALLTCLSWGSFMGSRFFLAWSIGLDPEPLYFASAIAAAGLFSLLPISLQGVGTRDIALVVLLAPIGFLAEEAIGLSTLILSVMVIDIAVSWAAQTWLPKNPIS